MNFKNFLAIIFITCSAVGFLFAQDNKSAGDQYLEQLQIEQENEANSKRAAELTAARAATFFSGLNMFLPDAKDSWAVSITVNGGIMGGSRLIAAVNSKGNYLCSSRKTDFTNNFVGNEVFTEIARLANDDFALLKPGKHPLFIPQFSYCRDCSYETFNVVIRRDKSIEIFQFNFSERAAFAPELKRIYEKVSGISECQ